VDVVHRPLTLSSPLSSFSVNALKGARMKISVPCLAVTVLITCVSVPAFAQVSATDVVLTVNEEPVYSWEVGLLIPQIQQEMVRQGTQPEQDAVIQASMQRVVDSKLLAQEARRREMQPDDERVKAMMARIEQQAGGREKLDQTLSQFGMTYAMLEQSIRESDLVQVFIETTIEPEIVVTADEVEKFYNQNQQMFQRPEQVHARHILIKSGADATADAKATARAKAVSARKRAIAGEDFAGLAKELSEGPSAPQGGDLGFFSREQMVAPFSEAAFALEVGQISEIVETQFGFHVIKVEEKRPASTMSLDEAREPLEQMLRQNASGQATSQVLDGLAEKATITQVAPPNAAVGDEKE
jgi:peptidyl-prolyl cis-trans isomerase C